MLPKLISLERVGDLFESGTSVAIGGQSVFMNPMGLVRALLRSGCRSLDLVASPVGGLAVDLLIGADAVKSVEFAQVSLWEYGMAPHFRRSAEEGRIELREHA